MPWFAPTYNAAPQSTQPVVRVNRDSGSREFALMRWGLVPFWAKDPKFGYSTINARAEEAASKPAYREALKKRRCLVPADAFYEWQRTSEKNKQPYAIALKSGEPCALAGLWESWKPQEGPTLETFTILTTDPNELMQTIHDRMPVILAKDDWSMWLNPNYDLPVALTKLLIPCPDEWLEKTAVSTLINSVKNDSSECIRPVRPERTLF